MDEMMSPDQEISFSLICRNIEELSREEAICQLVKLQEQSLEQDLQNARDIGIAWGIDENSIPQNLTLEKQFGLSAFAAIAQNLSHTQAQDLLKESYRQKFIKEILKNKLLKHQWTEK